MVDQYYTKREISLECIKLLKKTVNINDDDLFIEPCAGDGSFSDYFKENKYNIDTYDIEPKKTYIIKQDFLELNIEKYQNNKYNIHSIGNPPFGRQSSLAKKFIRKCALFSDTISFILPKSFRKDSYQRGFPLNFHLIKEIDVEKNSFIINEKVHNVPCVFQIWIKKDINRYIEPLQIENGFKWIKKPTLNNTKENIFEEMPDFGILRVGGGKTCGRLSLNYNSGIKCYPEGWYFIKLDNKYNKIIFQEEYDKIDWIDDSNVGPRSISKQIFIKNINKILLTMN